MELTISPAPAPIQPANQVTGAARQVDFDQLARSSPVLHGRYPTTDQEADQADELIGELCILPPRTWLAGRITALMLHFYVAEIPEIVQSVISTDWLKELNEYPDWAVERACQWWVSKNNPKRHKKPVPGDISARADHEMGPVNVARAMIERRRRYGDNPPDFLVTKGKLK